MVTTRFFVCHYWPPCVPCLVRRQSHIVVFTIITLDGSNGCGVDAACIYFDIEGVYFVRLACFGSCAYKL